mgnify:FL=1
MKPMLALLLTLTIGLIATPYAEASESDSPIKVTVAVLDVDSISSADQSFTINVLVQFRWHDPMLAHDGPGHIRRNLTEVSAPRFLLLNRQRTWSTLVNVVDIAPDGEAIYRMRLWGDFSQPLQLRDFPFDSHVFEIPIIAIHQETGPALLIQDPEATSFIASELSVADWRIIESTGAAKELVLTTAETAEGFVFSFRAERIYNHYVIKFIVPLILIVMMSWIVFWIDPEESGSQLSVAMTAALTLIAYHIALAGKLPDIPYLTRMDLFLFGSTLLVFSALLEVVITSRLAKGGRAELAHRLDGICRFVFPLAYLAIAIFSLGSRSS